jgi:aryl-alcohol dehydrogenase-like predicted oxidoreductase
MMCLSSLGFGAFKLGRNWDIKYPNSYQLPTEIEAEDLLNSVLDMGYKYIDTAPAYGCSEDRIGRYIGHRRGAYQLSTKVGEMYGDGAVRNYDFSANGMRRSVAESLRRLHTDYVDLLLLHADGEDTWMCDDSIVDEMRGFKRRERAAGIGVSCKTVAGARAALKWADAIMVEFNSEDTSFEEVMKEAKWQGIQVIVKKGLNSGKTADVTGSIKRILKRDYVSSLLVGSINLDHLRQNIALAREAGF